MHRLVTMLHLRWSTTAVAIGGIIATGAGATMTAVDTDIEPHHALFQCSACMTYDPYHCPCDAMPGFTFACVIKFGASQLGSTSMSDIDSSAQSPCIRNCCLDDDHTCLGCFRSLEEIKEWGVVDSHRRRIILHNAKQRRGAYQMLGEVSPRSISPANDG